MTFEVFLFRLSCFFCLADRKRNTVQIQQATANNDTCNISRLANKGCVDLHCCSVLFIFVILDVCNIW